MRFLVAMLVFTASLASSSIAAAQITDFATCPTTLGTCSASVTSCCKKPFSPTATAKAIVIPMDRCHQRVATSGVEAPPGAGAPRLASGAANLGEGWCVAPGASGDDGVFQAYGLVYRMMQHDIPVYWIVNPTKDPTALTQYQNAGAQEQLATDVDVWVLASGASIPGPSIGLASCGSGCTEPVRRLNNTNLSPISGSYPYSQLPLRGGAFVIAPEDRAQFDAFWLKQGAYASLGSKYSFPDIDMYELDASARFAYSNHLTNVDVDGFAPVAVTINYEAPRIARIGSTSAVATSWLAKANLDDPASAFTCGLASFSPSDAVYCNVSETFVTLGGLVTGNFGWAWIDKWSDNSPCDSFAERTMFDKLGEFMTAVPGVRTAGNIFAMESSVQVAEECTSRQLLGNRSGSLGLKTDNNAVNETADNPYIFRYPSNLFMQWGDLPMNFQSGAVTAFRYSGNGATGYNPIYDGAGSTLKRLVTLESNASGGNPQCTAHKSAASCDIYGAAGDVVDMATYARYNNVGVNGLVFYTGGNQIQNNTAHLRLVLNSLIATPLATIDQESISTEIARSSPVVATIENQEALVQGTYTSLLPIPSISVLATVGDAAAFRFPFLGGHMRAVALSGIPSSATTFNGLPVIFDAADHIPTPNFAGCGSAAFTGTCRTVFTTTASGFKPARVELTSANLDLLKPLLSSNLTDAVTSTLLQRVLAGKEVSPGVFEPRLGGVDRSTPAVIPASPVAGTARPTMAYFGAADGMLHAVCASIQGPCTQLGTELWAFVPRTLLSDLRFNTAHVDGSPRVMDMFGDFDGDGRKEFRTILLIQTGQGDVTALLRVPAVYALDITDPTNPSVLWEYSMPSITTRAEFELGQGLIVNAGRVQVNGVEKLLAFAQTNNAGTAGAGSVTVAIDIETGSVVWKHGYAYPAARGTLNPGVPFTGVPGGAITVDKQKNGFVTDIVLGTLYGDIFQLDAATGANQHGTNPLFRFTTDFHPIGTTPAVYSNGNQQFAVVGTGGYADPHGSSWAGIGTTQYAFAVSLSTPATAAPLHEGSGSPYVPFLYSFGAGEKAFAQALVVGNEIFINTDTADVNSLLYGVLGASTGKSYRLSFSGSAGTSTALKGGASSVVNSSAGLYSGASSGTQRLSSDAAGTTGESVDSSGTAKVSRRLWLKTQ